MTPPRLSLPSALRAGRAATTTLFQSSSRPFTSSPSSKIGLEAFKLRNPSAGSSNRKLLTLDETKKAKRENAAAAAAAAASSGAGGDAAERLLDRFRSRTEDAIRGRENQLEYLQQQKTSGDYLRQMPRRWVVGDVYSPSDLSPTQMSKWRKRTPRNEDVIDAMGLRPADMYRNYALIQEFTNSAGQIKPSMTTRLRPVNQRKIAKMVRRAQGLGLYSTIHAHPELIRSDFFPFSN